MQLTGLEKVISRYEGILPPGIRLRAVDLASDPPRIADLYNAVFEAEDPGKVTPEEVTRLTQHPGLKPTGAFLAFDGDLAVGLGVGSVDMPTPGMAEHQGAIELLIVRPGYRRQGIGRALVHAVLSWLAEQGVVTVGVSAEDPGVLGVLKKYGFQPVASPG